MNWRWENDEGVPLTRTESYHDLRAHCSLSGVLIGSNSSPDRRPSSRTSGGMWNDPFLETDGDMERESTGSPRCDQGSLSIIVNDDVSDFNVSVYPDASHSSGSSVAFWVDMGCSARRSRRPMMSRKFHETTIMSIERAPKFSIPLRFRGITKCRTSTRRNANHSVALRSVGRGRGESIYRLPVPGPRHGARASSQTNRWIMSVHRALNHYRCERNGIDYLGLSFNGGNIDSHLNAYGELSAVNALNSLGVSRNIHCSNSSMHNIVSSISDMQIGKFSLLNNDPPVATNQSKTDEGERELCNRLMNLSLPLPPLTEPSADSVMELSHQLDDIHLAQQLPK